MTDANTPQICIRLTHPAALRELDEPDRLPSTSPLTRRSASTWHRDSSRKRSKHQQRLLPPPRPRLLHGGQPDSDWHGCGTAARLTGNGAPALRSPAHRGSAIVYPRSSIDQELRPSNPHSSEIKLEQSRWTPTTPKQSRIGNYCARYSAIVWRIPLIPSLVPIVCRSRGPAARPCLVDRLDKFMLKAAALCKSTCPLRIVSETLRHLRPMGTTGNGGTEQTWSAGGRSHRHRHGRTNFYMTVRSNPSSQFPWKPLLPCMPVPHLSSTPSDLLTNWRRL